MVCAEVVHSRIGRHERVAGTSSNEVLASYEGTHHAPLRWIREGATDCPTRADVTSETELEVTLRGSELCSERQSCKGQPPSNHLYVPVVAEIETRDGRIDESYDAWIAVTENSTYLTSGFGHFAIRDEPRNVKLELERSGQRTLLRGFVEGWGPRGNVPTACFWKCEAEPALNDVEGPVSPARALALLAQTRLKPATPRAEAPLVLETDPLTFEINPASRRVCVPRANAMPQSFPPPGAGAPTSGPNAPAYTFPARLRLRTRSGARVATLQADVAVTKLSDCDSCATITLAGTAPLEYSALLEVEDKRGIAAHAFFWLELGVEESKASSVRGTLKITYLDRRNQEMEQTHDLTSAIRLR
jgi:hypothetical protein